MESYGLQAGVYSVIAKHKSRGTYFGSALADVSYQVRVFCSLNGQDDQEKPHIFIQLDLFARVWNEDASMGEQFFYARWARKIVRIDNENCEKAGNRMCLYLNDANRRIANFQTPLEFTLSVATTSFGDYEDDTLSGREYGHYEDVLNSLVDTGFSATFRVTSRPSCREAGCTCGPELYGLQLTLGYFTATIGEYFFFENDATYRMSSALQNNGWSIVLWEKDSEWRFTKMRRVDLYCNSSSGSPTWYAYIRTRCIEYDNEGRSIHDSTDSWMGTIDCYESCEFSADDSGGLPRSRAAGDSIPLGDVQNVEYLGRENGQPECDPPDLPVVRIGQSETC
jgi:hypothetical protein